MDAKKKRKIGMYGSKNVVGIFFYITTRTSVKAHLSRLCRELFHS